MRSKKWDHFGLDREDFLDLSEVKQLQITRKFYFENLSSSSKINIDSSIGSGNDKIEMTLSTNATTEEKTVKCINMWKNHGFFGTESCDFSIEESYHA